MVWLSASSCEWVFASARQDEDESTAARAPLACRTCTVFDDSARPGFPSGSNQDSTLGPHLAAIALTKHTKLLLHLGEPLRHVCQDPGNHSECRYVLPKVLRVDLVEGVRFRVVPIIVMLARGLQPEARNASRHNWADVGSTAAAADLRRSHWCQQACDLFEAGNGCG